jgi:methyltransferase (TIGR00027 family)
MKQGSSDDRDVTVADTAKWVAMYRAIESDRPDALFRDPYARRLAGTRGEFILRRMPRGRTWGWPMIVRTAVIDELLTRVIRDDGVDLVVNLAAGLDARPYRMDLPPTLRWIEVDYPATIEEKTQALAAETPRCELVRIPTDLADPTARRALFEQIAAQGTKGLVISEGLMIYLTREQAGELARELAAVANLRFWILDSAAPFILKLMSRTWSKRMGPSATFRFAPEEGAAFYERFGWKLVEYRSSWLEARRLKREPPMGWIWRLLYPRYSRQEQNRRTGPMTGVLLLSR